MTDSVELVAAIRRLALGIVGHGPAPRHPDGSTRLSDGHWLDSVELFELVLACEAEFGVVFDGPADLEPPTFETLGSLAEVVRAKLAGRGRES